MKKSGFLEEKIASVLQLFIAGFTVLFMLNPSSSVFAQLNNINTATNVSRVFYRFNPNQIINEGDWICSSKVCAIALVKRENRVAHSKHGDSTCDAEIFFIHEANCGNNSKFIKRINNGCDTKLTVNVFTPQELDIAERVWDCTPRMSNEQVFRPHCIELSDGLINAFTWKEFHRSHQHLSHHLPHLMFGFVKFLHTCYSDHSFSTYCDLTGCISKSNIFTGSGSTIGTEVGDSIPDDKNKSCTVCYLSVSGRDTKNESPKYFREAHDYRMPSVFMRVGDGGMAWRLTGFDFDVSWDGLNWYHLLGDSCLKSYKQVSIENPKSN